MAKKEIIDHTIIHEKKIENIFSDAFGRYAKYIIQDRALPDIRDGLKPVQRRIVYAMNDLGIVHDKDYKKSARSVGEVIGKYHPHGDSSIYDAMVRMSQDWKNNIPLIDMHGNNGSIDNDPAAAMRYTESRLSLYAEALITDIKKKIVPFIENFDGSEEEPTVLPSLMPNLLINGASGIAAGYATNIPPFNAQELLDALIKRIDSPECKIETIINIMPGPDFPTGGIILNKENMKDIYETGRGRIFIRSKIELASKKQAFITQIPYEVNKADLIDEINECADKFDTLNIKDCHDETDQNGLSICINFSDTENFEFVKNFLFKNTSLQISYNFNMIAIKDRKPCMFSIFTYLDSFIQHCENIVLNSTKFDLAEVKKRKEVVVGLIKAIKMIDAIIDLIKKSNNKQNAKEKLVTQYKFSEVQAESIVSLRLYSLSNSDVTALEQELIELNKLIDEYTKIISDKDYRNSHIKNIFRGFKKVFKFPRRTQFSEESVANIKIESSEVVEDKDVYIVVTKDGYIKNVPQRSFESSVYEEMGLKENDIQIFQTKTSQKNKLIFVTNKGNYFATPIHKIESDKWKDFGVHLNSIVELQSEERIINCFVYNEKENENKVLVIASKKNMIKRTMLNDLSVSRLNKPSTIMGLDEDDEIINCLLTIKNDAPEANELIGAVTQTGSVLLYPVNQINIIGKNGSGVKNLNTTEEISSIFIDNPINAFLVLAANQGAKKIKRELLSIGKRAGKPKPMIASNKINVISSFEINNSDTVNVLYDDKFVFTSAKDITVGNANTKVFPIRAHKIIALNSVGLFNQAKVEESEEQISLFDK